MLLCLIIFGLLDSSQSASIVNGNHKPIEPNLGEVPFQASLMLNINNSFLTICGGSLIHPRWILTAAHCLEQDDQPFPINLIYVALGSIYTNGKGAQRIRAERVVINKKYFESEGYDIGLIKLKSNARLSASVKVVKLHTNNAESLIGKTAYLTGFGIINDHYQQATKLRKAILHIDRPTRCLMNSNSNSEICCSSSISEGKACKGDSGGPLTIINNGKYVQVGITSHLAILPFCKVSFNNSVYTRVSAYIAWISKATEFKCRSPTFSEDSGKPSSHLMGPQQRQFHTTVQLRRKPGESLGMVLTTGNSELDPCPSIASFRPGSVALNSDQLMPGDRIYSVNGITTSRMRPEEVTTLLDNVDGNAMLEIEYSLPNYASQSSLCVTSRVTEVVIERIDGSLGITLRGGLVPEHPQLSRPLVITQVRQNGPAFRTGMIRVGDRLLKVDHYSLVNKTLLEAQQILKENTQSNTHGIILTTLTIEYDVSIMESVKYANGPLLLEIDRQMEEDFGLVLTNCSDMESEDIISAGFYVENIIPTSTADRCGALSIGDQLLAIDDLVLDTWSGNPQDAEKLLRRATKLQILPSHIIRRANSRNNYGQYSGSPGGTEFSTINSRRSRNNRNRLNRQSTLNKPYDSDGGVNYCGCPNNRGVSHPESLNVILTSERGYGYGLAVSVGDHTENRSADILVSRIVTDSPAYRCGCLQVGDRLISVNHQPNLTLQEINSILELGNEPNGVGKITLQVEFDVADTIVPSSGIFTVKLPKRGPGLGITITASKTRPDEPFVISEIRRGSVAHRTGTLHAGDRLLAIDNHPLDHLSLETAFDILQTSTNDIVTLKVEKTETDNSNLFLDSVVYTVELHRCGGPLGITISGSEDCMDPIILSRLTEGGLAARTGALHVGDRILAINGENLEQRPLSDAIRLLQGSGDRVQLKIARHLKPSDDNRCNYSSPGLMSVDSAIHSWDSNTAETTNDNATDIQEIKDIESILSEPLSYQDHDKDSTTTKSKKRDSQLQYYSDSEEIFCPSPLPLPNYTFTNTMKYENSFAQSPNSFIDRLPGTYSNESMLDNEVYHVTLYKDSIYDDYGFSVSDGLYEKGVYVNRIRKGGPADIVGLLKPYDRIIQVNDTKTQDFDCCLTVPLIASAGDRIELVVARNPYLNYFDKDLHDVSKKSFSASQNTITKTL